MRFLLLKNGPDTVIEGLDRGVQVERPERD